MLTSPRISSENPLLRRRQAYMVFRIVTVSSKAHTGPLVIKPLDVFLEMTRSLCSPEKIPSSSPTLKSPEKTVIHQIHRAGVVGSSAPATALSSRPGKPPHVDIRWDVYVCAHVPGSTTANTGSHVLLISRREDFSPLPSGIQDVPERSRLL